MTTVSGEIEEQGGDRRMRSVRIRHPERSLGRQRPLPRTPAAETNDFRATSGAENACRDLKARDNGRKAARGGRGPSAFGKSRVNRKTLLGAACLLAVTVVGVAHSAGLVDTPGSMRLGAMITE